MSKKRESTDAKQDGSGSSKKEVNVSAWLEQTKPRSKPFSGPRGVDVPLRVSMDRSPYAEVIAHAKESLDAEICGVLVGELGEDDLGLHVHVKAGIRGEQAKQGKAHVTYTQETWNKVHEVMERDYPKLSIVGWYHSHPGFGVEFSDMDLFIQKNFFPGLARIGLVTDPLGGEVALMATTERGIEHLSRFWVDGREQRCQLPQQTPAESGTAPSTDGVPSKSIEVLENRITQLVQAVDDLRGSLSRFLLTIGMMVCFVLVAGILYYAYHSWVSERRPPENIGFSSIPIEIDGKRYLLGVGVTKWQIPESLDANAGKDRIEKAKLFLRIDSSGLLGVAPNAGFPAALPWPALGARAILEGREIKIIRK